MRRAKEFVRTRLLCRSELASQRTPSLFDEPATASSDGRWHEDRAPSAGRWIRGTQQDPHSRLSCSAQEVARFCGPEGTAPSRIDMNKLIWLKVPSWPAGPNTRGEAQERAMDFQRGRWGGARLRRVVETCCLVQSPSSKRPARRTRNTYSHLGKVQERPARHLLALGGRGRTRGSFRAMHCCGERVGWAYWERL